MSTTKKENSCLSYKGFPIVRAGDIIYYGNLSDKVIIMMQILEKSKNQDLELSTKISIQLQYTDPDLKARDRVIKSSIKSGFYTAIDLANIWLERALAGK
ncbi:MAG: hypothetical protein RR436_00215 [Clostridia bacterium]